MAVLSDRDAARWHAIGGRVTAAAEPRLDGRVVANRALRLGPRWVLLPVGPALRRARRLSAAMARRSESLLRTDVASFYHSITPATLHRALIATGVEAADARAAAAMLEGWGSDGYPGLPIGPPASAVMANVVLREVDAAVGPPFVRWVDDYLVAVASDRQARQVLERLDEGLRCLGLSRSVAKTHLLPGRGVPRWLGRSAAGGATG